MPEQVSPNRCPLCHVNTQEPFAVGADDRAVLNCPSCGNHKLSEEAYRYLPGALTDDRRRIAIAHNVWRRPAGTDITSADLAHFVDRGEVPGPMERVDLLVEYMAENLEPGQTAMLPSYSFYARLGCVSGQAFMWVVDQALRMGYVEGTTKAAALSVTGWARYDELKRNNVDSTYAFMAMHYSDEMHRVYWDHLVPAVKATGFDLRTANGPHQPAGSIDDRMRVEIRTSRFLVCDISDGNRGAYWEAGFAEGLGRPVFYVCRADVLRDLSHPHHPHFDTRQSLIVPWDLADMAPGVLKLKQAIRATLPEVARMED